MRTDEFLDAVLEVQQRMGQAKLAQAGQHGKDRHAQKHIGKNTRFELSFD